MNNMDKEKILDSVLASSGSDLDRKALADAVKKKDKNGLINSLSDEDKKKLNSVLNNKQALSDAINSPEARALIKALFGGKNG